MNRNRRNLFALIAGFALACQPKPAESTTPIEQVAPAGPCEARFQATRAYVTFAVPPHDDAFFLGPLATDEIISSLRATGCEPRPDLPEHPAMIDALSKGALIISTITFIGDLPNSAEVVVGEPGFGDPASPDARGFALRVHRARPLTLADAKPDAQTAAERWRISSIALQSK